MSKTTRSRSRSASVKSSASSAATIPRTPRAGFRRRFGAWAIDSLLVIPLLTVAGYLGYGLSHLLVISGLVSKIGRAHV